MATLYVDRFGTTGIPAVRNHPNASKHQSGKIRYITEPYTMKGSETNADIIRISPLYAGEMVLTHLSDVVVTSDIAGASTTLHIGDTDGSGDVDRYATSLDVAAPGRDAFDEFPVREITEDCWLTANFPVLNTPIEGGVIWFRVAVRGA